MSNELVKIASFDSIADANILHVKLESEDIECFVYDETVVGLSKAHIFVRKEDYHKAKFLLDSF